MSIEISIQNLADAINNLASAYGAAPAQAAEAAPEADPPKRGRGRAAKDQTDIPAAAPDTSSEGDTASAATATSADKVVVDAGTGQPIAAPAASDDDLRARCKAEGVKLAAAPEGGEKLTGLLRKHSGIADGPAPGFSKVPDAALPGFLADVQAELAMAG